jgi:ComF family protein
MECHFEVEFAFDSARAIGEYEGVLKEAIHQLKYSGHRVLGPVLSALLLERIRLGDYAMQVDCIIPIPVHSSRLRQRGFNQSELLAQGISCAFDLPLLRGVLLRTIATKQQIGLLIEKRRENVEGAFKVARNDAVEGRRILLLDDVLTTGSTADSAARALRDAGAKAIHVLTLARSL